MSTSASGPIAVDAKQIIIMPPNHSKDMGGDLRIDGQVFPWSISDQIAVKPVRDEHGNRGYLVSIQIFCDKVVDQR